MSLSESRGGESGLKGSDGPGSVGVNVEARHAQLVELLECQLVGQTLATIKTKNELMRINVDGVKMESLDEVKSAGKGKAEVQGMLLCQNVRRMIGFGGLELEIMLETNFDVVAMQLERQAKFNMYEQCKLETSELVDEVVTKPSREDMDDTINLAVLEKRHDLKRERSEFLTNRRSTRGSAAASGAESESEMERAEAHKSIEAAVSELKDEVTMREIRKYKNAVLEYELKLEKVRVAKRKNKLSVEEQTVEQLMLSILSGYVSVINIIVNKIKEYVRHFPDILSAVSMLVRLKGTSITISNPYESSNLSGLVQNMMSKYFKPSFVTFQQSLLEALSLRITEQGLKDDPVKIVQDVGRIISMWETLKFWDFMTPDMFFTTVLLNALPEGKDRSSVVMEIARHLAALARERGEGPHVANLQDMTTFNYVSEYLEMLKESQTKKVGGGQVQRRPWTGGSHPNRNNRVGDGEMAALAEGTTVAAGQMYKREVLPAEKVVIAHPVTQKPFLYCATRAVCKNCSHTPVCWGKSCFKCGFFGHTEKICHQDPSVYIKRSGAEKPERGAVARDYGAMADREEE